MKNTVSEYEFTQLFIEKRPDNFSGEALKTLYNYFEELEISCDIPVKFDPIAICWRFSEYTLEELCNKWGEDYFNLEMSKSEIESKISYHTSYVGYCKAEETYILADF